METMNANGSVVRAPQQDGFLDGDSEMARLIRSIDWSASPLGPISTWPQSLRTTVSLCLASNFPINIIWGPQRIQIYNDGYRVVCGDKHPAALGMDYRECWASAWPAIGAPFDRALVGQTSFLENQRMYLFRNAYLEETFFTFSHSPIRDESGGIGGLFHPVTETTASMVGERRTRALRDLTVQLGGADSGADVAHRTIATLAEFALDLPFLLLYELDPAAGHYRLAGATGLADGSALRPTVLAPAGATPWPLERLLREPGTVELENIRAWFGTQPCGPYDEAPQRAFMIGLRAPQSALPVALLIAGASPRLPMDDMYRGFYEMLAATIGAALARVAAAERERQRVESLAELDRAKTVFFSNVSHEFRTPLTLMLGPLEELLDGAGLADDQRARLGIAHRNALRLLKLVNSLLDFSRIEAGRTAARFVATDLAALTADLASNFRSACERAGLTLTVDSPPLPEPVWIDRDMWEKIVLNLLSNAFKFTLHGGLTVTLRAVGGGAELVVADSGVGIAAAELPHIFDRFHRVEGQQGRSVEGSGIGLSLVRELAALQGGAVSVTSAPGQGSRFTVTIPFGRAHLPRQDGAATVTPAVVSSGAAAYADEALRWLPDAPALPNFAADLVPADGQPLVLLADDNADMRNYIQRILEEGGYRVHAVDNGAAALHAVQGGLRPDLVLSDVMMPGLDGFQLLAALRADPASRGLLVILLSARAGEDARMDGLHAGADDYLVKPFGARELRARIDGAVRLARERASAGLREQALLRTIEQERATLVLRGTQDQLALALQAGGLGSWELDLVDGRFTVSDGLLANFGIDPTAGLADYAALLRLTHPEHLQRQQQAVALAIKSGADLDIEYRIIRPDGGAGWVQLKGQPFYDAAGTPLRLVGVSLDITTRKLVAERQQQLLNELNHRVKNTLSVVQSIAFQTVRNNDAPDQFAAVFNGRIRALAAAHDLLTRDGWQGASLADLVGLTMLPFSGGAAGARRLDVAGPPVTLTPNMAITLNMAFHELATNAAKYGALSEPQGRVVIEWWLTRGAAGLLVEIAWVEQDGPIVRPPARRGFGSRLLEQAMVREMDAAIMLQFAPAGVRCTIRIPLPNSDADR